LTNKESLAPSDVIMSKPLPATSPVQVSTGKADEGKKLNQAIQVQKLHLYCRELSLLKIQIC
jgi:hypothetical protein